jgi:hypothetical protein
MLLHLAPGVQLWDLWPWPRTSHFSEHGQVFRQKALRAFITLCICLPLAVLSSLPAFQRI